MEASAEATWRRAVAIARRTYSRSRSVMPSEVTYVRYTGKAAMTSRSARVRAVDEDAVQEVQELVAGGAGGGPRLRQLLTRRQDLLGHDVDLAARAPLEPPEIVGGVVEPVGVIDAQPGHRSLAHEAEEQAVGRFEHLRLLHPDGGQLVDVEEAPVVDLLAGDAPVGGAVRLVGEQRVQRLHALGVAGLAVEEPDVVLDEDARGEIGSTVSK